MSRKVRMNCFGQICYDPHRNPIEFTGSAPKIPYQFKTIDDVAYCRFDARSRTAIQRMEKTSPNDVITQTWAFGRWDDCASLTYYPINEILEVEL